jgi:agmatinase
MINYGGISEEYSQLNNSQIVILPVPYDGTSTWIKGADKGPEAILEASANMELYDIETESEVYKLGIFTAPFINENSSPEKMVQVVYNEAKKYIDLEKFLVTIGGEHSISSAPAKAICEKYKDVTVLQIDAHSDLRPEYEHSKYNHACVMARIQEFCPILQVGIRSMDTVELPNMDKSRVYFAHEIRKNHLWIEDLLKQLTENTYITIDLDGFDPSVLPATGTPEPGGLLWEQVMDLIVAVNKNSNIVGLDVMELCPNENHPASNFLATKLIYRILSEKYFGK